jgi:ribose/xylose/arabinose/galactoside ABC-type transport system permease subunit
VTSTSVRESLAPKRLDQAAPSTKVKHLIGDYGILVVFAVVLVYLSFAAPSFLTVDNLINIVRQSSIIGFIALGMTFVMITAGIDLSVGSLVGLTGVVAATLAPAEGAAFVLPILVGLAIGVLVGVVNSALIVYGAVLPFLATLAMMAVVRSAALVFTNGQPVTSLSAPFDWLGAGMVGPIPVPVILFLIAALVLDFVLSRTAFGRHVYAIGGNEESSRKVGISVRRILIAVYVLAGVMAAIAGLVLTARVDGADPLAGTMYELQAIAAVVIGGTSLFGGIGTIRGTVIGVLLVGVVLNGLNLLNVSSYYQQAVQGLILVLAVLLNRWKSD